MAAENRTENRETGKPIQVAGADNGTGTNPGTTTKRKRTGTAGATTGNNSGTTTGADKEKVIPELADIKSEEVPKPKPAKQKRTRTTNKKNNTTFNAEQITSFLVTLSGVLSTSESGKFFALSQAEAEQLALPLANIIAKNDSLNGLGEHSDTIALAGACALIFIPRLIGYLAYVKAKKAEKNIKLKIKKEQLPNGQKTEDSRNNGQINEPSTVAHSGDSQGILSGLPSLTY